MIATHEAANILLKTRCERKLIDSLPDNCRPADIDTAYKCQSELTELMLKHYGGNIIGYKTGCTNAAIQEQMGIDSPFYGPLLSPFVHETPAKLKTAESNMRIIEAEFAFQMGTDLPCRDQEYSIEEVSNAVAAVLPSIEIVDSCFTDWLKVGIESLIADNACNAAWIYGQPKKNWRDYDLVNHEVKLFVNGKLECKGIGGAVMGHPLNPLVWLANMLSKSGTGLKKGDMVTTGLTTEIKLAKADDNIVADFGPIGTVEVNFT